MKKFAALVAVLALVAFAAPAFAANPFMDVPMNHWAYDAVSQLASRGVVSGYPDGAFKGEWKATRYEMASVVARALAYVDMNKASKQDLELLKKLVVEFKDELDALGVKVDELDSRVAVLEEGVGGWKFWGELRFDAKWADDGDSYGLTGDTDFTMSRFRIWLQKKVDDKVTFIARLGGADATFERYYVSVKQLPWDMTAWIGKWNFDWEDEDGFYVDNDAWFTDQTPMGFYLSKPFAMGKFDVFVAHEDAVETTSSTTVLFEEDWDSTSTSWFGHSHYYWRVDDIWLETTVTREVQDAYYYGARLKFNFNEKFGLGLVGLWKDYTNDWAADWTTYWVQGFVNFTDGIQLRGRYIWQDIDGMDGTNAWQAILQVHESVLGFTSLWIEYAQLDQGFFIDTDDPYANYGAGVLGQVMVDDAKVLFVRADQTWSEKWGTFQRYVDVDSGQYGDVTNWTFGINYWYTPNMKMELLYDDVSYDTWDDSMIRLRTHVWF